MKSRKRCGRKVKHTRTNLYRKKKTRGQKIFGTVLLVIAVLAAAFLGYCLGKPLLEFFEKNAQREEPEWIPPAVTTTAPENLQPDETSASGTSAPESAPSETSAAEAEPAANGTVRALTAPVTSLQNQTALYTFVARARASGYNTVILPLKDEKGYLHYASPAAARLSEGLVQSTLTAGEIARVFGSEGMKVIGAVSVLADDAGCNADMDMCYKIINEKNTSWLDFDYDPPIFWADPAKEAVLGYFKEIAGELEDAGIEVMLRGLVFPDLNEYDRAYLDGKYFEESRSAMLLPYAEENAFVEMSAEDITGENLGRTAELLREKKFTESGGTAAVRIRRESFPAGDGWPADAAGLVEDILARVRLKAGGLTVIPVIESAGFSEAELEAVRKLLGSTGFIVD